MIRAISYGGGVQSTALLVLAATHRINFPLFLFANVGDDSEDPRTLDYVHDVAAPYAADHGIELVELRRVMRDGSTPTLLDEIGRLPRRDVIPVRNEESGRPGIRACTNDFKIRVVGRELRRRGANRDDPATVGVGISLDEIQRANSRRAGKYERLVYPLIGVGEDTGLALRRSDCRGVIADAGLPIPPKSSCYFCPFHRLSTWAAMAEDRPEVFARAAEVEATINRNRDGLGKPHVYLTSTGLPLAQAIDAGQPLLPMFDEDDGTGSCDSGFCFT